MTPPPPPPPHAAPPEERRVLAVLGAGLTLVGAAVRLPGLGASFYGDEGFSLLRDSAQLVTATEDRFRPLFFSILYLWKQLGFRGELGLRALPFAFGVLQVPVAFRLGLLVGGVELATSFGVLVALSPLLIEFSQELRMYSLVPLVALLQAWAFVSAATRATSGRSTRLAWLAFVAAGVAGVYAHVHYWFIIAGFGVAVLRRRRELPLRQGITALAAIVAVYLPDVPNLLRFQREAAGAPHLVATDLPSALPKLVTAFGVGFNYFVLPHMGIERTIRWSLLGPNALLAVLLAVPAALVGWQIVQLHRARPLPPALWLSYELFVVPTLVSFAAVLALKRDFIHPKYMVFSAPFFLIGVAGGYTAIRSRAARIAAGLTGLTVYAVAIVHFNQPRDYGRREDWRAAALYLRAHLGDGDVLLWPGPSGAPEQSPPHEPPQSLWEYYAPDLAARTHVMVLPRPGATVDDVTPIVARAVAGKQHVYYLWSEILANVDDPSDVLVTAARRQLVGEQQVRFNPRLVVYSWNAAP